VDLRWVGCWLVSRKDYQG